MPWILPSRVAVRMHFDWPSLKHSSAYFTHVRYNKPLTRVFVGAGFFWLAIPIDILTASIAGIMMLAMRTTITLEDDVAAKLRELAHQRRTSFKRTVNETLRAGLAAGKKPAGRTKFRVEAVACGFQPGVDPARLNQLLDELETDDFRRTLEEK